MQKMKSPAAKAFWTHGSVCASHPCEVLFIITTATLTMISFVDWQKEANPITINPDYHGIDILFMTAVRCGAVLFTYHQFQSLSQNGSKYFLGIAVLIVVFSSIVFCCTVLKLLDCDVSDLKDAVFFFLLLTDLSKAKFLAQFAFDSKSYREVQENIAEGLSVLGPSLTLDTIAEALLIGAGTLSGVSRVEQMCRYAVLSIIINYIFLMSFYPSFLSLVLEFSHRCSANTLYWPRINHRNKAETTKSNPILQGVKIIMSAGLFLVHGITRWSFDPEKHRISVVDFDHIENRNSSSEPPFIIKWLNAGLDHAILMVILVVLLIKYTFFESFLPLNDNLKSTYEEMEKRAQDSGKEMVSKRSTNASTQTQCSEVLNKEDVDQRKPRTLEECIRISQNQDGILELNDAEILLLLHNKHLQHRVLEAKLKDSSRAVSLRRAFLSSKICSEEAFNSLPFLNYNYDKLIGTCCENVVGYVPVPVGVAGPLKVNGKEYMVPMATTEGALIASTSRGCKAVTASGGAKSLVFKDAMSRGPVVELPSSEKAIEVYKWIKKKDNFSILEESFNATSRFARLSNIHVFIAARLLYIRFEATTGDAMGMNMVAKGTEAALSTLKQFFPELVVDSISGNVCTDKKPSAINWILGRGKSVVCEATINSEVVQSVLKTSTTKLVETNEKKNYIGSSIAGSIGGNNAHAANIIASLFIACGQDPAQVVESCSCLTVMEKKGDSGDLYVSVTMPCIEVGTVGGGTTLDPQSACLNMLGVKGPSKENSGENANRLATIAAAAVLSGELSLLASLAERTLVKSHLTLNRRPKS